MRKLIFTCLVISSLSLCSCSQFIVKSNYESQPTWAGDPYVSVDKQVYLWGIIKSRAAHVDIPGTQCDTPLSEVRVKKNFGQGLLSIISLGIVNLSTVEYYCAQT